MTTAVIERCTRTFVCGHLRDNLCGRRTARQLLAFDRLIERRSEAGGGKPAPESAEARARVGEGEGGGQDKRWRHAPAVKAASAHGLVRHEPTSAVCRATARTGVPTGKPACRLRSAALRYHKMGGKAALGYQADDAVRPHSRILERTSRPKNTSPSPVRPAVGVSCGHCLCRGDSTVCNGVELRPSTNRRLAARSRRSVSPWNFPVSGH